MITWPKIELNFFFNKITQLLGLSYLWQYFLKRFCSYVEHFEGENAKAIDAKMQKKIDCDQNGLA